MNDPRWARLEELFAAAEPLPPAERAALLDASFAAAPDPELRAELEDMLAAEESTVEERMAVLIARQASGLGDPEAMPRRLGPYLVRGEIGRGGMATVYEAARDDREFERAVAVKVIRRGMDTADIVRRLRRERQILANLDHPNIARLLDGGSLSDGRPYVVMELIAGEPIDQYCRGRQLDLRARLGLFRQVCDAVNYAHRNLVLHRDIKPSNILVGAAGVPKLLDFGIAKLLEGDDAGEPSLDSTLTGVRLLTPAWASPEQVRGAPLSTSSDVYSLGLLLYLLVADRRAYEVDPHRPAELERLVCEIEPKPPGRGDDLDLIVMAALRKEPERRYPSAEQLSEDVRRYLENLPVSARRDTFGYRSAKFVRRHRWGVAAAVAVFLALAAAALYARHQAQEARDQQARAEQVAKLLTEVLGASDPNEARGRKLTDRQLLDQAATRVRHRLREDPELLAEMLGNLGRINQRLGEYEVAQELLEEALELRGGRHAETAEAAAALRDLAALVQERGRSVEALEMAGEALVKGQRFADSKPSEIFNSRMLVGDIQTALGHLAEAELSYLEALAIQGKSGEPSSEELARVYNSLGELHYQQGLIEKAKAAIDRGLKIRRELLEADHPDLVTSVNNLAVVERELGHPGPARDLFAEAVAARRRIYGEKHGEVALVLSNLAQTEADLGDFLSAIEHMEQVLEINRHTFGDRHPVVATSLYNLGMLHQKSGELNLANVFYEQALTLRRQILGREDPKLAESLRVLAALQEVADPSKAELYWREALEIDRQALPAGDPRIAESQDGLGRLALRQGSALEAMRAE